MPRAAKIDTGSRLLNRKIQKATRRFLRRVVTGKALLGLLKTLWKTIGSIIKLNVVLEIQPIDVMDPQKFVGGIVKSIRWVREMERWHKKVFGGNIKRGSKYDLRWRIIALSTKEEDSLRTLYNASPMADPRAVALQWRYIHKQDKERMQDIPRRGRSRFRSAAQQRRMAVRGYTGPITPSASTGYQQPAGYGDTDVDVFDEPPEMSDRTKEEKPMNNLTESSRRAILNMSGSHEPLNSPGDLLEAKDFDTFFKKMRKKNPKLTRDDASKMYKQYMKKATERSRVERFADMVEKKLTAKQRKALPDSAFAYVDKDGNRHYPIHDEAHVKAAIAYAKKYKDETAKKAWPKIKKEAKKYEIDPGSLSEAFNKRGVRDGTGPYKDSAQRAMTGNKGKRQVAGEKCPVKKKDKKKKDKE